MVLPNRHIQDANAYRYAYQGQEKDPETGKEAFELRLWDGRIGRWLTTDPKGQYASPYLGMGNDPINGIDPDGGFKWKWWAKVVNYIVGGNGIGYDNNKEEYYVKTSFYFEEKANVLYDGKQYISTVPGVGFKNIFKSPFFIKARARGTLGVQLTQKMEIAGVGIGLDAYLHRIEVFNFNFDSSKKDFFNKSGTVFDGWNPSNDVTGLKISTPYVKGGIEYRNDDSNDLIIPGSLKSTQIGFPILGDNKIEYNRNGSISKQTQSWTIIKSNFAIVLGLHGDVKIGYTF